MQKAPKMVAPASASTIMEVDPEHTPRLLCFCCQECMYTYACTYAYNAYLAGSDYLRQTAPLLCAQPQIPSSSLSHYYLKLRDSNQKIL